MPQKYIDFCEREGIKYEIHTELSPEVINSTDILYMTRVQRERFPSIEEYNRVKDCYSLNRAMLDGARENLRVLHPLPRLNEINDDVDDSPKAYYFDQARNGLFARQAMICRVLGIDVDALRRQFDNK